MKPTVFGSLCFLLFAQCKKYYSNRMIFYFYNNKDMMQKKSFWLFLWAFLYCWETMIKEMRNKCYLNNFVWKPNLAKPSACEFILKVRSHTHTQTKEAFVSHSLLFSGPSVCLEKNVLLFTGSPSGASFSVISLTADHGGTLDGEYGIRLSVMKPARLDLSEANGPCDG